MCRHLRPVATLPQGEFLPYACLNKKGRCQPRNPRITVCGTTQRAGKRFSAGPSGGRGPLGRSGRIAEVQRRSSYAVNAGCGQVWSIFAVRVMARSAEQTVCTSTTAKARIPGHQLLRRRTSMRTVLLVRTPRTGSLSNASEACGKTFAV